jgi:hypothetical protein
VSPTARVRERVSVNLLGQIYLFKEGGIVMVRKFRSVRFSLDLAGVEGPWVPLMLGDAPSLLEHLESNLKSNEFSKLSLAVRLRVIACYRDRFVCVFSFPIPHPPVRLSLSLILSTLSSLLVFIVEILF